MSFMTVLEKVGHDIASIFEKAEPVINEIQTVAAPIEQVFMPGLPTLISAGLTAIENTEALAAAAGKQQGSGATKLALVTSSLATSLSPTLIALGVDPTKVTNAQYTNFINGLVQAANAFITTQPVPVSNTNVPLSQAAAQTGAAVVQGK